MSTKIAVVGDRDSIYPYRALGIELHPVDEPQHAKGVIDTILSEKVDAYLILLTEQVAKSLERELRILRGLPHVVFLVIPAGIESKGYAMEKIRSLIRQAIGRDILK